MHTLPEKIVLKRLGLLPLLIASVGHAAEDASVPAERFQPALTREGLVDVEDATVGKHLDFDLGVVFGYALNPLVLTIGGERAEPLVAHRISADLVGAISLFDWVQLGIHAPLVLFQGRDDAALRERMSDVGSLSFAGLGDMRLVPKVQILRHQHHLVDLALAVPIGLPTGFPTGSYFGEGGPTFSPTALLGLTLGDFRVLGNLGVKVRGERTVRDLSLAPELTWRGGVSYDLRRVSGVPLNVDATANGATALFAPFTTGANENPLEVLLGARYEVFGPLLLTAYAGAGIIGGYGVPDFRAGVGLRFAPRSHDRDGDGIDDENDRCPDEPEDRDGFEDEDGCPDLDNDADGIPDAVDVCPLEAEDVDGFEDEDGCPDLDNDHDGIADVSDECPDVAGVAEWRGCPVPDKDGDGVPDPSDRCPEEPGPAERDGCPRPDQDKDGVFDDEDVCPKEPGPAETKGCPDRDGDGIPDREDECPDEPGLPVLMGCPDRDSDGIPDHLDKCPDEPETVNGVKDDDGCPDQGKIVVLVTEKKVELKEKVYFDTGKATIQPRSYKLLDQVVLVLKATPRIKLVRVEGHTDDRGSDEFNMRLSQARADAVRDYLVQHGVQPERLVSVGYGESQPIDDNQTRAGRERNRRVELTILEQ